MISNELIRVEARTLIRRLRRQGWTFTEIVWLGDELREQVQGDQGANKGVVDVCIQTARRNGHSELAALECHEMSVGCPDCPFKEQE